MALWTYEMHGGNWQSTVGRVDVSMFSEGNAQPPGRSIMQFKSWTAANVAEYLTTIDAIDDWSRIVAVVIDEPYLTALGGGANPCSSASQATITATRNKILNGAAALRAVAPRTRLWVNYSEPEVQWMRHATCPANLNGPYIDVVSIDKYDVPFNSVRPYYYWFMATMPQQQLALVPGAFFRDGGTAYLPSLFLQGYFDFANLMNERCDLGFGNVGVTGNYDGCRVWMVAGWLAQNAPEGTNPNYYIGILDPRSQYISDAWQTQFNLPRRLPPRKLSSSELDTFKLLLDE